MIAGIAGYIINGLIWHYAMKLSLADFKLSSSFYLVFWLLACGLIASERFIIHYYESFGYRRLFRKVPGATSDISRRSLLLMFESSTSVTFEVKPKVFSRMNSNGYAKRSRMPLMAK